tara:strand:- start:420 stop:617 length:198 start_codon:yes stop_codon:yes gene_type:complete
MSIKFDHSQAKIDGVEVYSIKVYRNSDNQEDSNFGYIDSFHPMNIEELQKLKNYLSDLIWKEFNH